jgi:hypothetical protein
MATTGQLERRRPAGDQERAPAVGAVVLPVGVPSVGVPSVTGAAGIGPRDGGHAARGHGIPVTGYPGP